MSDLFPFTASNGTEFRLVDSEEYSSPIIEWRSKAHEAWVPFGQPRILDGVFGIAIKSRLWEAFRELLAAERDDSLGRWRSKEHPDYVVYPEPTGDHELTFGSGINLVVLRESDGVVKGYSVAEDDYPGDTTRPHDNPFALVARAYFAAHPEPKPLPTEEGVYAASPRVHPHERLLQLRNGEWIHLRRSASEFESDDCSAEQVAQTAVNEGRLTRLIAEVK